MSSSTYTVQSGDTEVGTRSKKESAINLADDFAAENPDALVQVLTEAGTVVHEIEPLADDEQEHATEDQINDAIEAGEQAAAAEETPAEAEARRTRSWSRTDEAKTFSAPVIPGFTHAYTRERIATAIYRADDKSGWLVFDTRVDDTDYAGVKVANTTEARLLTNKMHEDWRAAADIAKAAAKEAKATATAEKKAKQAADKKAKADEKAAAKAKREKDAADKKAAKEAAKAEKVVEDAIEEQADEESADADLADANA